MAISTLEKVAAYTRPEAWVLEPEPSTFAPNSRWSNKDMDPVPPKGVSADLCCYLVMTARTKC